MTSTLAPHWLSDPAWLAMDATARGFHAQLLLLAARRKPAGALPDDDLLWRKWLGLPTKTVPVKEAQLAKAWMKACSDQGLPAILVGSMQQAMETGQGSAAQDPAALTEWLWLNRWKPMVLAAWERIDEDMAEANPKLSNMIGGWFHPVALAMAAGEAPAAPAIERPGKKKPRKTPTLPAPGAWGEQLGVEGEAANGGLSYLDTTSSGLRDPKAVLARWRPEVDQQSRKSMWDMGIYCMVGAQAPENEKSKARRVLGKYIKQYGEEAVAKAVGQMAVRSVPPADAVAFMQGILRQAEEGTTAQQAARQKRANLNL